MTPAPATDSTTSRSPEVQIPPQISVDWLSSMYQTLYDEVKGSKIDGDGRFQLLTSCMAKIDARLDGFQKTMTDQCAQFNLLMKKLDKQPAPPSSRPMAPIRKPDPIYSPTQVNHQCWENLSGERPLGYRSSNVNLATRRSVLKKGDIPVFAGENVCDWLAAVEHFFALGRYHEHERLDMVALCFHGDAKIWFNWVLHRRGMFSCWKSFREQVTARFGDSIDDSLDDSPETRLFYIKQTGSITAYIAEFEELSTQVSGLEDSFLERIFYKGLSQEMKEAIKLNDPQGLPNIIAAVRRIETSAFDKVPSNFDNLVSSEELHQHCSSAEASEITETISATVSHVDILLQNVSPLESDEAGELRCEVAAIDCLEKPVLCMEDELQITTVSSLDTNGVLQMQETEHSVIFDDLAASQIGGHHNIQVEKQIESPILERNHLTSQLNVTAVEASAEVPQYWSDILEAAMRNEFSDHSSNKTHAAVKLSLGWPIVLKSSCVHQRKFYKTWKFKFKAKLHLEKLRDTIVAPLYHFLMHRLAEIILMTFGKQHFEPKQKRCKSRYFKYKPDQWDMQRQHNQVLCFTDFAGDRGENSWLSSREFIARFPYFKLEGKLGFDGRGIDRYQQAYVRRKKNESVELRKKADEKEGKNEAKT